MISLFRHGVRVGLSQVRRIPGPRSCTKQPVGRTLLEVLRDREDDVLRFVGDLRVPPTSNQAERDVRPAKTQQNTSGRLTSEARTRDRYRIRGVISTDPVGESCDTLSICTALIFRGDMILAAVGLPPFPAAEWACHVASAAPLAGGSRRHRQGCQGLVPQGQPGDPDP